MTRTCRRTAKYQKYTITALPSIDLASTLPGELGLTHETPAEARPMHCIKRASWQMGAGATDSKQETCK